jgi:arylsulfatase A-like enzyme
VLLLVLDTVRAQNLSAYGYARPTSPRIAALAEKGVRFEHAISTASWTTPSHFSMVTGRFPHELIGSRRNVMDATHPTLAEVLGARGYVSGGFVANVEYAGYETGFDRGFLHFEDYPASLAELALSSSVAEALVNDATLRNLTGEHQILGRKPADDVNRHFLDWLSKQDRGRPFFAFLNYFDAHEIYLPPHPWDDEFRSAAGRDVSGTQHFKRRVEIPHKKPVTPARIQSMLDAYDGSIAYLDHELGRLFDELELRGILDDTIVIVTSDHGEQFGEHGKFEHGNSLYRQLVEVPLVIRFPPRIPAGATVAEPVSLRDLAATALDLAGADRGGIGGRSLASLWSETSPRQAHQPLLSEWAGRSLTPPLPETHRSALWRATAFVRRKLGIQDSQRQGLRIRMKSLVADGYHYIRLGDGTEELYDFHSDPPEERDLARSGEASEQLARFRTSLQELLALGPDGVEASPEANLEPATRLTNQDVPR